MFKFGIDWSEQHHNLCIRNSKGAIVSQVEFKHTLAGFQRLDDESLLSRQKGHSLSPARGNVRSNERVDERSCHRAAAVSHEVDLERARYRHVPVRERLDGDLLARLLR